MTRETYLDYRNRGNVLLLWEYYNEKYTGPNKKDINTFIETMFQYPAKQQCFQVAVQEYDAKFNIMTVIDKTTGEVIKVY